MGSYEVQDSRVTHQGVMSRLRVDRILMPDGHVAEREVVEHADAVAVVPVDDDGKVVLLRQYRHPVGDSILEIPAGKLDGDGEGHEAAARRELLEETGVEAARLVPLVAFHNSAGWTTESTTIYLGTGLRPARKPDDFVAKAEEADMEIVRLPLDQAVTLAEGGQVPDAKTLVGLLLASRTLARS